MTYQISNGSGHNITANDQSTINIYKEASVEVTKAPSFTSKDILRILFFSMLVPTVVLLILIVAKIIHPHNDTPVIIDATLVISITTVPYLMWKFSA